VTRTVGIATCGIKCGMASLTSPDIGVRFEKGALFGSLYAKEKFGAYTAHCFYKVTNELKCAATVDMGGKKSGNFSVGASYEIKKGTTLKAKVLQDQSVHCSLKHAISKGFTCIAGGKYDIKKGSYTYGLQLSIE